MRSLRYWLTLHLTFLFQSGEDQTIHVRPFHCFGPTFLALHLFLRPWDEGENCERHHERLSKSVIWCNGWRRNQLEIFKSSALPELKMHWISRINLVTLHRRYDFWILNSIGKCYNLLMNAVCSRPWVALAVLKCAKAAFLKVSWVFALRGRSCFSFWSALRGWLI